LRAGGKSLIANCGYGHGYSVREVLSSVEQIAGLKLDIREEPRRAGDLPALIAKAGKVREVLGWQPKLDNIDTIVRTALEWERHLQREPW
jgi:UDP-glucose 4-epimerase